MSDIRAFILKNAGDPDPASSFVFVGTWEEFGRYCESTEVVYASIMTANARFPTSREPGKVDSFNVVFHVATEDGTVTLLSRDEVTKYTKGMKPADFAVFESVVPKGDENYGRLLRIDERLRRSSRKM